MKNLAKPVLRVLTGLVDITILQTPFVYIIYWISQSYEYGMIFDRVWRTIFIILIYVLAISFIQSFLISKFGGTLGNLLTGTEVVSPEGKRISFWRAFFRNHLGFAVSGMFLWLGFIWVFIDKEYRGWHDMMANTFVVVTKKSMYMVGLIVFVLLFWLNISLMFKAVNNFYRNANMYIELVVPESTPRALPVLDEV